MINHILNHVILLINKDLEFHQPINKQLKLQINSDSKLGSTDKFFIKEIFFSYLRNKLIIDSYLSEKDSSKQTRISLLLLDLELIHSGRRKKIYENFLSYFEIDDPQKAKNDFLEKFDKDDLHSVNKYSFNSYYLKEFKRIFEKNDIDKVLNKLHSFAPVSVIVHRNHEFENQLEMHNNLKFEKSAFFEDSLFYKSTIDLNNTNLIKNGIIEIQDIGSRIICELINPKADTKLLDACAGAGGKSLSLAKLTSGKTKIYSHDVNDKKLDILVERSARHNYKSITTVNNNNLRNLPNDFDYVLVDAPCSGSGTVRRFPEKKYTITSSLIENFSEKQYEIIHMYSRFVKEGGYLFYSTCSIFEKENEFVANRFINSNDDFYKVNLYDYCNNELLDKLIVKDNFVNIFPTKYDGDCFFFAAFKKGKS